MSRVLPIDTPALGDRSYLVHDARASTIAAEKRADPALTRTERRLVDDLLADVPQGEVRVHCAAGYRASIAASLLAAAGRRVVAVDDDFGNAARAGLPVATP